MWGSIVLYSVGRAISATHALPIRKGSTNSVGTILRGTLC